MTLKKLRTARKAAGSFSPERSHVRALLRKAARGNVYAYVHAASNYTNLISEYLYLAGFTNREQRLFGVEQVLSDCWRYLPYTRRVSDFERFLQVRLERHAANPFPRFPALHQRLARLSHEQRFLLVARVLEEWGPKSLKLALRCSKRELSWELMRLKSALCGLALDSLSDDEQSQIFCVSELLEGEYADRQSRKVERELSGHFQALQFKADWLEYRCELADLRMEMSLSPEDAIELNERTTQLIRQQPMEKPRFSDSLINQFSFVRLPLL